MSGPVTRSFSTLFEQRVADGADEIGYRYLNGEHGEACLTYGQLAYSAYDIAREIKRHIHQGQRVVLLYPAGLEFIKALYACLLANIVAVPLPLPKLNEPTRRLDHVVRDCDPAVIFTEMSSLKQVDTFLPDEYRHLVVTTDINFELERTRHSTVSADEDVAVLQYTSGSTSAPKGVVLRSANLFANLLQIKLAFGHSRESAGVIWLPHYHDMGLIGGILQPFYAGFPVTLMSPISFIQRPLRWLQAIHKYRATTSGGPNFAYDLCVAKAAGLEEHVDLSSWDVAFNGAEPVKMSTLNAFSSAFSRAGFRRSAFTPCYGLAEATLIVTSTEKVKEPLAIDSSDERIIAHGISTPSRGQLVSSGLSTQGTCIRIMRINSEECCSEGEIGEVVAEGPSVASGYWCRNDRAFSSASPGVVKTGDLGFLLNGELFITGRLSDLIVVRGKNIFPEDIEATARAAEPLLAREGTAAFSVEGYATEELVLIQEVGLRTLRSLDLAAVRDEVGRLVMQRHGISVSAYVPVRAGSLVRTSSGKISRFSCKQLYEKDQLIPLPMLSHSTYQV